MSNIIEVTLPVSGKKATMRRPTGRDMIEAEMLIKNSEGTRTYMIAMLSRVTMIDGITLPFEDFQMMAAEDITFLGALDHPKESPPMPSSDSQN